ncbi:UNKNOWN [Stylonychia lemnae]|uniref:Amino acid transporter transmembrane domain-containing protein n=1 Tax=Stylonychia lemnae TaxID=5949 RepID=A0A078AXY7_STYLE|nr:UNKNOWN [Stylonychia lemnae]|eukprot:CDW86951.1 UNKNOWN [Stylonychia lemnae]
MDNSSKDRFPTTFANNSNLENRGSSYDYLDNSTNRKKQLNNDLYTPLIEHQIRQRSGLTVIGAVRSYISTIIGAGIVSLPYVILKAGYLFGIFLHITVIMILMFVTHLLLKARQNLGLESFGEIAYICLGRPSIFIINFVITAATSLIVTMYALLFSKICVSFAQSLFGDTSNSDNPFEQMITMRFFYVILLYIILMPFVLKKNFKELKLTSILLIVGVISMLLIFFAKANFKSYFINENDKKVDIYQKGSIVDSIFIVLTAYGYILNYYPIFSQLEVKTNKNGYLSPLLAMIFCFITYLSFSYFAMETYGEYLNPNIFENIQVESNIPSYFIRLIFLAIFICNIPFIFLPGKECLLMSIDEGRNKTISKQIERRIEILKGDNQSHNKSKNDEDLNGALISQRVSNTIYYSQSVGLFTLQLLLAVLIEDITIIFGFFAALSDSTTNFILPGLFYIISFRVAGKQPHTLTLIASYLWVLAGLSLFFFANYNNIRKITTSAI